MISFFLSLAFGLLACFVTLRLTERDGEIRKFWFTRVVTAAFMGLAMWKLTPLWTRWDVVFYNPLLLLSMNSGMSGVLGGAFAFAGVVGFSLWQGRKMNPDVRRRPLFVALAVGVAVVALGSSVEPLGRLANPPAGDQPGLAIETLVPDLEGRRHALSDWRGKVVIVNFWATWCPPCLAEIPEFQRFTQAPSDRVVVVGVDLVGTERGGLASVMRFTSEHKMNWTQLADTEGGDLQRSFGVTSIPTTVVLDAQGRVVDRRVGAVDQFWLRSQAARAGR